VEGLHNYFVGASELLVHNICNPFGLPSTPWVYHIEGFGQYYTGSAKDIASRLTKAHEQAGPLLADPNVKIYIQRINLGAATTDTETNHVLRFFEQTVMDVRKNVPKVGGSRNIDRAAGLNKIDIFASQANDLGASISNSVETFGNF